MESELNDDQRRLLVEALVTYSDACTLPALSPACPYYRLDHGRATCDEECVELIESWGGGHRSIGDVKIGGLVLTGRKLPLRAAGSADPYDATRAYLEQRSLPLEEQSTGTLLIGLGSAFNKFPWPNIEDRVLRVNELWAELERRQIPVESVIQSAIVPQVATQIGILAAMPLLREGGRWDELVSDDELDRVDQRAVEWSELLQHAFDRDGGEAEVSTRIAGWLDTARTNRHLDDVFRLQPVPFLTGGEDHEAQQARRLILADLRLPYAFSTRFTDRVAQWLNRLLSEDLAEVVSWGAPPPAVFLALPSTTYQDEVGLWVWDRFTRTNIDEWSTSSLLREWRGNDEGALDQRVWLERVCDPEEVATMALARLTEKARQAHPAPKLSADSFVSAAIRHLESGSPREAAEIFEGLAELRPTDGDVLNNLGFCLIPSNPSAALTVLQRASLFPMKQGAINAANRVLALTLLGRTEDALQFARESLRRQPVPDIPDFCYAWSISADPSQLRLRTPIDPLVYLRELVDYLEGGHAPDHRTGP